MNCDLHTTAAVLRDGARACATRLVAPAAPAIDRAGVIPDEVRSGARAVLSDSATADVTAWVVAVEELAVVSAAVALDAVGGQAAGVAAPPWPGLRGADVDGLAAAFAVGSREHLAVTAVLVGLGRAAVEQAVAALRAARTAGRTDDGAQSPLADAATLLDGARLLLWDAARQGTEAARAMARLQAIEAVRAALGAAERATEAEASRPGTPLDRIARDIATTVRVFGTAVAAEDAVAAAVLPG